MRRLVMLFLIACAVLVALGGLYVTKAALHIDIVPGVNVVPDEIDRYFSEP